MKRINGLMHAWEIIPGLWQADLIGAIEMRADCIVTCSPLGELSAGFADLVKRVPMHVLFPFLDAPQLPDMTQLRFVALLMAAECAAGKRVIGHCNEGRNRSGLLIGTVLKLLRFDDPVGTIHKAHPEALTNETFVAYLRGQDVGELISHPCPRCGHAWSQHGERGCTKQVVTGPSHDASGGPQRGDCGCTERPIPKPVSFVSILTWT